MSAIRRSSTSNSVTIASSGNLSSALEMSGASGGIIQMPAAWTAASIGFKVCNTVDGTYLPLYDQDGVLVQIDSPAVDKAYTMPTELFGALYVKLWSQNGSGTNTNQGAARTLTVTIKG